MEATRELNTERLGKSAARRIFDDMEALRAENKKLRDALEISAVYADSREVLEENERLRDALKGVLTTLANRDTMDGSVTAVHKAFETARAALYGQKALVLKGYSCAGYTGKKVEGGQ